MSMRWLVSIVALILVVGAAQAQAQEKQTARPQVGQPVQQAGELLKERRFKDALAKLAAADAVPDKTPYERYVIDGTRAAVDLGSGDYPGAIKALQAVLATGILSGQDALVRLQTVVQLEYQVKDYPAVVADANRYYQQGGTGDLARQLQAQAYYLQNDFADASKTLHAVLQEDDKAGKKPDENLLLTLLNSEFQQKDQAGRIDTLKRLVALYPKPQYWSDLLAAIGKQPGFADRLNLDLDRLKLATGAMTAANDYMEAAQLALLDSLPGDAKAFLDKGYATGALGKDAEAGRETRLATMVSQQVANGSKALPQQASAATDANSLERLGETYASYGEYDQAIAAYARALQLGKLTHPEDTKLHLGLAQLSGGHKAKAKDTLGGVGGNDGTRDLAQLWLIHAQL